MSGRARSGAIALLLVALAAAAIAGLLHQSKQVVESQIRGNLVAGTLLTRIQLAGERMRRFEKEMFIYVTVTDRREAYVKQFDEAYQAMLVDLDTALAPSGQAFTDAERDEMLRWKSAATTYVLAFDQLNIAARLLDRPESAAVAQLKTTQDFNKAIDSAKDTFRVLLRGTEAMRTSKKTDAALIASEVERSMVVMALSAGIVCSLVGAAMAVLLRRRGNMSAVTGESVPPRLAVVRPAG